MYNGLLFRDNGHVQHTKDEDIYIYTKHDLRNYCLFSISCPTLVTWIFPLVVDVRRMIVRLAREKEMVNVIEDEEGVYQ